MHRLYDICTTTLYIFPKIFTFVVIKVGNKSHGVCNLFVFFPFWKILHICSTAAAIRMPESIRIQAAWFTVPMSYYIFQGMSLMPTVLSRTMSRNSNIGAEESKSRYPLSTLFGLSSDLYRITQ